MKIVTLVVCTYLVLVLQSALAWDLSLAGFAPNFILAGLAVMTSRTSGTQGILLAAFWGLLADCLTEGALGPQVVCFSIGGRMLHRTANRSSVRTPWGLAALSIPFTFSSLMGGQILRGLFERKGIEFVALANNAAGSALYTGILVMAAGMAFHCIKAQSSKTSSPASPAVSNKWRMLTG